MEEPDVHIVDEIDVDEALENARTDAASKSRDWKILVLPCFLAGVAYYVGRFEAVCAALLFYLILIVLGWSADHRLLSLELIKEVRESRYALLRKMEGLKAEHPANDLEH